MEKLDQRLKQIQESFEKQQREMQRELRAPDPRAAGADRVAQAAARQHADQCRRRPRPTNAAPAVAVTPEQLNELNAKVDSVVEAQKKVLPSEFNPSIGFVGETIFSYRSKGSDQTGSERPGGFDVFQRSMELNIAASVDPFAKGYAVHQCLGGCGHGRSESRGGGGGAGDDLVAVEPGAKGGAVLRGVRAPVLHPRSRAAVCESSAGARRNTSAASPRRTARKLNWLPPTAHYISLTAGVGDKFGGDCPNSTTRALTAPLSELNFWGRLSTYFDLTPNWQLEGGHLGPVESENRRPRRRADQLNGTAGRHAA